MPTKQKYLPHTLVAASILAVFSLFLQHKLTTQSLAREKADPSFISAQHPNITAEDRKPLVLSAETIKNGRVAEVPILMYHHVGTVPPSGVRDATRIGLTVGPENFQQQVAWLHQQRYHSISLDDLYNFSQGKKQLPTRPIIFTFDDGYDDVFINAVPILKKYGYTGTFGIITSWPGWVNGTNTYATWQQITDAKSQGMEIVCHTQNHFDGTNKKFDAAYIYQNLSGCQKGLIDHLGSAEPYLIYPYGHYNSTYIDQAKKAAFVMSLTVHEGKIINLDNLMEVPRIRVSAGTSLEKFIENLTK